MKTTTIIAFFGIALFFLFAMVGVDGGVSYVYAETNKIILLPAHDATLDEDDARGNYGNDNILASGWSNSANRNDDNVKRVETYLKFDIKEIPKEDLFQSVDIDSAHLNLLIQTIWGNASRFIVTTSSCNDNSWIDKEITWENRVCSNKEKRGQDSVILDSKDLPSSFSWDVTRALSDSNIKNEITLIVSTLPLPDTRNITSPAELSTLKIPASLVWAWSSERENFGISAAPTLSIVYTVSPSPFVDSMTFFLTMVVPTMAIITPLVVWMFRKRKNEKISKGNCNAS